MTPSIESFEDAANLDTPTLRLLLDSARPEQRVWAIWALALRERGDVAELAPRTTIEPNPGVRRTLAVILASHGEIALLVALSRSDPDLAVRESATQLVTRLAAGGAIEPAVVIEAAQREPAIQLAILAVIDASAPPFLAQIASQLLEDDEEAVQLDAFEALRRIGTPISRARATAWLARAERRIAIEACRRWVRVADPEAIAREVEPLPAGIRRVALRQLHAPKWSVVERLVGDDPDLLTEAVSRDDIEPSLRVLGQLVVDSHCREFVARLRDRLTGLADVPPDFGALVGDLRQRCAQRIDALEVERTTPEPAILRAVPEGSDAWNEEMFAYLDAAEYRRDEHDLVASLLAQLERLIVH